MRPKSVELQVPLAGPQVVQVTALDPVNGDEWAIVFCTDITTGADATAALLELGMVLPTRDKGGGGRGDSSVRIRPCRWSQLNDDFFVNRKDGASELRIEADWAAPSRTLAASLTTVWDDDGISAVRAGNHQPRDLFDARQQWSLAESSTPPLFTKATRRNVRRGGAESAGSAA
jgi:hypothetical protein